MLPTKLYLDTARLGQTSPSALQAQIDFARLTAEDPSSLYFEKFLRDGVDACPEIADRFPGLAHWHGIADLKRRLASMAGDPDQLRVLLANRSAELMRLAARCQFQVCRNVLVTDLSWPNWLAILKEEATRAGGRVTMAHISRAIMRARCSSDDVCHHLSRVYATHECDGLFLPIVSNLGVHLPVAKIVTALRTVSPVNYTIADGAQALNHVDLTEPMKASDFIIAGAHKWMRAYLPMAIGFLGNYAVNTNASILACTETEIAKQDDPLVRMTQSDNNDYAETVNLSPFAACSGALTDIQMLNPSRHPCLSPTNSNAIVAVSRTTSWQPITPKNEFRSSILLIRSQLPQIRRSAPFAIRANLHRTGVTASSYPAGYVRVSVPSESITPEQRCILAQALDAFTRNSEIALPGLRIQ